MSSRVASPLLSAWVQSLFMNTEQRDDSRRTRADASSGRWTASMSRSILRNCCTKNSPVPAAHLEPVTLPTIRPPASTV